MPTKKKAIKKTYVLTRKLGKLRGGKKGSGAKVRATSAKSAAKKFIRKAKVDIPSNGTRTVVLRRRTKKGVSKRVLKYRVGKSKVEKNKLIVKRKSSRKSKGTGVPMSVLNEAMESMLKF